MVSRKSSTKAKEKASSKGGKGRSEKKRAVSKGSTKSKTLTPSASKRQQKVAMEKATTTSVQSPTMNNNDDVVEEVRSSMDEVIDNAKKIVGVA